jgi:hypothetical protein
MFKSSIQILPSLLIKTTPAIIPPYLKNIS